MDTTAVILGLFYGLLTAMVCYVVAMVTSGLFARQAYRFYAKTLVGICSVMLLAPGMRWLGNQSPHWATVALTVSQYLVVALLAYAVKRFNHDTLREIASGRKTVALFTFGTLANASIVTLVFLHLSITRSPLWQEMAHSHIGVWNYGPLLVALAAMIFHTDYHLKRASCSSSPGRLTRMSFLGYAVSFMGLAMALLPYASALLLDSQFVFRDSPFLQNFYSVQALLIAAALYAWLVWRYETIPPLLLWLLVLVGLYHVLVSQWVIGRYGAASWALASLPLLIALSALNRLVSSLDRRKRAAEAGVISDRAAADGLRFAVPFRLVEWGLAAAAICVTLFVRFTQSDSGSDVWLAATFGIYAVFFVFVAVKRAEPQFVYVSGMLTGLAILLGPGEALGQQSTVMLGVLSLFWSSLAFIGQKRGLTLCWRTPTTDVGFITAVIVLAIVFSRHFLGSTAYYFQVVQAIDAVALLPVVLSFVVAAHQYRSWLPVFAILFALVTAIPPLSAGIGLVATITASLLNRWIGKEPAIAMEDRVLILGAYPMPWPAVLPSLYANPLKMGAVPLALIGLITSAFHVVLGDLRFAILAGAAISAFVLTWQTRTYPIRSLYYVSLSAILFTALAVVRVIADQIGYLPLDSSPLDRTTQTLYLLVIAAAALISCLTAAFMAIRLKSPFTNERHFYAGNLHHFALVLAVTSLLALASLVSFAGSYSPAQTWSMLAAGAMLVVAFALSSIVYRWRLPTYGSLVAVFITSYLANETFALPIIRDSSEALRLSIAGLLCGGISWLWLRRANRIAEHSQFSIGQRVVRLLECWDQTEANRHTSLTSLWLTPLSQAAVLCCLGAVLFAGRDLILFDLSHIVQTPTNVWLFVAPLYLVAIALLASVPCRPFRWFLQVELDPKSKSTMRASDIDFLQRGLLLLSSILTVAAAVHLTVHLFFLRSIPTESVVAWHLCLAALLALVGWIIASAFTSRHFQNTESRSDAAIDSVENNAGRTLDRQLYGDTPRHLTCVVSLLVFCGVVLMSFQSTTAHTAIIVANGILVLFFALASTTDRPRVLSWISLLAVGLGAIQLSRIVAGIVTDATSLDSVALAGLALAGLSVGIVLMAQFTLRETGKTKLRAQWANSLAESSIVFALSSFVLMLSHAWSAGLPNIAVPGVLSSCFFVTLTFVIAAWLYRTALLTYLSLAVVTLASVPVVLILDLGISQLGLAISGLAFVAWCIAYFIAKKSHLHRSADNANALIIATIYERPLVRYSAAFAVISICTSMIAWNEYGWSESWAAISGTCAIGALILSLNARSLGQQGRYRSAQAVMLLACACLMGSSLATITNYLGLDSLGLGVAVTAFALSILGLGLSERARANRLGDDSTSASSFTLGAPVSYFGVGASLIAVAVAFVSRFNRLDFPILWGVTQTMDASLDWSQFAPIVATMLLFAVVCLITVRSQADPRWLTPAVLFAMFGTGLLIQILAAGLQFEGSVDPSLYLKRGLTLSGEAGNTWEIDSPLNGQTPFQTETSILPMLVFMNLLVILGRVIRFKRSSLKRLLGVYDKNYEQAFYVVPVLLTMVLLTLQTVAIGYSLTGWSAAVTPWPWHWAVPWHWAGILCSLVFFQTLYLQPRGIYLHLFIATSVIMVLGMSRNELLLVKPDVAVTALAISWGILAECVAMPFGRKAASLIRLPITATRQAKAVSIMHFWSVGLILSSITVATVIHQLSGSGMPDVTISLFIAAIGGIIAGLRWRSAATETASAMLLLLGIVSVGYHYVPPDLIRQYGSLAVVVIAMVYFGLSRLSNQQALKMSGDLFFAKVTQSLTNLAYAITACVVPFVLNAAMTAEPNFSLLLTASMLTLCWFWMTTTTGNVVTAYTAAISFILTLLCGVNAVVGGSLAASLVSALTILVTSFLFYGVNVVVSRSSRPTAGVWLRPTYHIALSLPIALIVAIPFDKTQIASGLLLATGSFYLLIAQQSQRRWPWYVAGGLLNWAVYLWLPSAHAFTGLYQLYVIPAAVTVLVFAQLHRRELNSSTLQSIRLAASGAILAVSTSEVYLAQNNGLLQFILVLALSLLGIILGIGLRIKPFIFAGIAFLILNVVSQLGMQFHREDGIIRAVILISVGLVVLAAMVFFNIHRERIIKQYRGFLLDDRWQ